MLAPMHSANCTSRASTLASPARTSSYPLRASVPLYPYPQGRSLACLVEGVLLLAPRGARPHLSYISGADSRLARRLIVSLPAIRSVVYLTRRLSHSPVVSLARPDCDALTGLAWPDLGLTSRPPAPTADSRVCLAPHGISSPHADRLCLQPFHLAWSIPSGPADLATTPSLIYLCVS